MGLAFQKLSGQGTIATQTLEKLSSIDSSIQSQTSSQQNDNLLINQNLELLNTKQGLSDLHKEALEFYGFDIPFNFSHTHFQGSGVYQFIFPETCYGRFYLDLRLFAAGANDEFDYFIVFYNNNQIVKKIHRFIRPSNYQYIEQEFILKSDKIIIYHSFEGSGFEISLNFHGFKQSLSATLNGLNNQLDYPL